MQFSTTSKSSSRLFHSNLALTELIFLIIYCTISTNKQQNTKWCHPFSTNFLPTLNKQFWHNKMSLNVGAIWTKATSNLFIFILAINQSSSLSPIIETSPHLLPPSIHLLFLRLCECKLICLGVCMCVDDGHTCMYARGRAHAHATRIACMHALAIRCKRKWDEMR